MSYNATTRFATGPLLHRVVFAFAVTLIGCGGDGAGPSTPPPPPPGVDRLEKANPSGDDQAGRPGAALPNPIRVIVVNGTSPVSGKTITWTPSAGSVSPTTSTTGNDGIASTTVTLPGSGAITITAASSGISGSPLTFAALVAEANATVQVLNNRFDPDDVAIVAGGTITFNWPAGSLQHNLIPDDGKNLPNEPTVHNGSFSVNFQFPTAGTYYYHCSVHGSTRAGMYGRIIVVP